MKWNPLRLKSAKAQSNHPEKPRPCESAPPSCAHNADVAETNAGFEGKMRLNGLDIQLSYSARDGIFANVKTIAPWKVLFEFCDGAYLVNDHARDYSDLLSALNQLREEQGAWDAVYQQLEKTVRTFFSAPAPEASR